MSMNTQFLGLLTKKNYNYEIHIGKSLIPIGVLLNK